ncbi:polymorphic toxin type 24 domain-containing protein [Pseudomonas sp. LJDD11]|uniref:polymorphic toxin type 24 domain-containing protein n=1 Tax=Pseudomonas sp. LJDD11 TaxID=2931984 RepID=UPI00359C8802
MVGSATPGNFWTHEKHGVCRSRVQPPVTGAAHANVQTPHVIEYGRNKLPDGTIRVQSPSTKLAPRPAKPGEIP